MHESSSGSSSPLTFNMRILPAQQTKTSHEHKVSKGAFVGAPESPFSPLAFLFLLNSLGREFLMFPPACQYYCSVLNRQKKKRKNGKRGRTRTG